MVQVNISKMFRPSLIKKYLFHLCGDQNSLRVMLISGILRMQNIGKMLKTTFRSDEVTIPVIKTLGEPDSEIK